MAPAWIPVADTLLSASASFLWYHSFCQSSQGVDFLICPETSTPRPRY